MMIIRTRYASMIYVEFKNLKTISTRVVPSLDSFNYPRMQRALLAAVDFAKRSFYRHKIFLILGIIYYKF